MSDYLFVRNKEAVLVATGSFNISVYKFPDPWMVFFGGLYHKIRAVVHRQESNPKIDLVKNYLTEVTSNTPTEDQVEIRLNQIIDLEDYYGNVFILTDRGVLSYTDKNNTELNMSQTRKYWAFTENACITANKDTAVLPTLSVARCPTNEPIVNRIEQLVKLDLFGRPPVKIIEL